MLALESNSAHRRLEQCSRTHSHAYHLWLLSPGHTGQSVDSLDPEIFEASSVPQNDKVPHVYCLFKIM